MLKLLGIQRGEEVVLPDDTMAPTQALKRGRAVYQSQAGIPTTADALAYDPVQRLLAVSLQYRLPFECSSSNCHNCSEQHLLLLVLPRRSAAVTVASRLWDKRALKDC